MMGMGTLAEENSDIAATLERVKPILGSKNQLARSQIRLIYKHSPGAPFVELNN
jgi:hypothetical protein